LGLCEAQMSALAIVSQPILSQPGSVLLSKLESRDLALCIAPAASNCPFAKLIRGS
jgi:hypothetical protein